MKLYFSNYSLERIPEVIRGLCEQGLSFNEIINHPDTIYTLKYFNIPKENWVLFVNENYKKFVYLWAGKYLKEALDYGINKNNIKILTEIFEYSNLKVPLNLDNIKLMKNYFKNLKEINLPFPEYSKFHFV